MYARLVRFSTVADSGPAAQKVADDLTPLIAKQPGCESVTVFGDENDGEYGIFVLWDSEEHAKAAAMIVRPVLDEHLSGYLTGPPDARLFPVLSP